MKNYVEEYSICLFGYKWYVFNQEFKYFFKQNEPSIFYEWNYFVKYYVFGRYKPSDYLLYRRK